MLALGEHGRQRLVLLGALRLGLGGVGEQGVVQALHRLVPIDIVLAGRRFDALVERLQAKVLGGLVGRRRLGAARVAALGGVQCRAPFRRFGAAAGGKHAAKRTGQAARHRGSLQRCGAFGWNRIGGALISTLS